MAHAIRIGVSFLCVLVAYWAYALLAVPLIEPAAAGPDGRRPEASELAAARQRVDSRLAELAGLFPAGAWQLDNPKILETDRVKLLLRDYSNLGDGRVRIQPCTLIYTPQPKPGRPPRPIVLDAPEGAVLKFDRPLDLRAGEVGRPISGRLLGEITIRGAGELPGEEDDLLIVTRDVELTEKRISTPQPVHFRWGRIVGSGQDMEIQLLEDDGGLHSAGRGPNITGIEQFEVRRLERLHLEFGPHSPLSSAAATPTGGRRAIAWERPVEVSCRGPFRFDAIRRVATFEDHVDVLQLSADGPSDQLNCERLSIDFSRSREGLSELLADKAGPEAPPPQGPWDLHPRRIEARGNPVIVRAPSRRLQARGRRLAYDVQTGELTLDGGDEVFLRQGESEIHAPSLQYQAAAQQGRLGRVFCRGPGWLRGQLNPGADGQVFLRWGDHLQVRPDQDQHVASLTGGAELSYAGVGRLTAEEIHFWMSEVPRPNPVAGGKRFELRPDRMLVRNQVDLDSPQVVGGVDQLEVWFQSEPAAEAADPPAGQPASPDAAGPDGQRSPDTTQGGAQQPPGSRYQVSGHLLQLGVVVRGRQAQLSKLTLEGNVRLEEIETENPGQQPVVVGGDQIKVTGADTPYMEISVIGQPAHFEGRGLTLEGTNINLNGGTNRLWIHGAGKLLLPLDRDLQGRPLAQVEMLAIDWQRRMDFDGLTAVFDESVIAQSRFQRLDTESLEVRFRQPIRFRRAGSQTQTQPDLEKIVCRGGVFLQSRKVDGPVPTSWEQIHTEDLTVNRRTGDISARGPGRMVTIRRGGPAGMNFGRSPGPRAQATSPPGDPAKLSYLSVRFQDSLSGNINRRSLTFHDRIRCAFTQIDDWDAVVAEDDPDALGPAGVLLSCDQLTVAETRTPVENRSAIELEALGNVVAENQTFTARAMRMTYAEAKDLLIAEGNGFAEAELSRQEYVGGPVSSSTARQFWIRPSTHDFQIIDGQQLEFSGLGGP